MWENINLCERLGVICFYSCEGRELIQCTWLGGWCRALMCPRVAPREAPRAYPWLRAMSSARDTVTLLSPLSFNLVGKCFQREALLVLGNYQNMTFYPGNLSHSVKCWLIAVIKASYYYLFDFWYVLLDWDAKFKWQVNLKLSLKFVRYWLWREWHVFGDMRVTAAWSCKILWHRNRAETTLWQHLQCSLHTSQGKFAPNRTNFEEFNLNGFT